MTTADLRLGDCLEVLRTMPDASVDAVVTDPPYGLSFMGKAWDYDVPTVEAWREVLRVLKPGGHLLAFAGTRTQHRMAVAIEDAGFEIRDMIAWVYGSGFPKSLDVSKAIDKAAGAEREVVGEKLTGKARTDDGWNGGQQMVPVTAPPRLRLSSGPAGALR
jgi:DNA modification methylase